MPWGAAIGAGVSAIANHALSSGSSSNGGAGTQTQTKEPWLQAQPWIINNLQTGQALQNRYAAQPFSDQQQQAYQNQNNQSAYMRAAVPSLLGQIQSQQVGFDRSNPNARPNAFSFDGLLSAARDGSQAVQAQQPAQPQGQGLLSMLTSAPSSAPLNLNPAPAPAAVGDFHQQTQSTNPADQYMSILRATMTPEQFTKNGWDANAGMNGSYGDFKYGMNGGKMPEPGTKAYRDMNEYFAYGGTDPYNFYGKGATFDPTTANGPMQYGAGGA